MGYTMYTSYGIRKIHKSFGHPSISVPEGFMRRSNIGHCIQTQGIPSKI